jgi:hypothetical protein
MLEQLKAKKSVPDLRNHRLDQLVELGNTPPRTVQKRREKNSIE